MDTTEKPPDAVAEIAGSLSAVVTRANGVIEDKGIVTVEKEKE